MRIVNSQWDPESGVLITELTGAVSTSDVMEWREGLHRELARLPAHSSFHLLMNLSGFEPVDIAAHKQMRTVIPEVLARHGLRPAFIDLFDERPEMHVTVSNGIRCVAFANVHHDETKMANYQQRIAKPNQQFFTDVNAALNWLKTF